jgi:hypothetical protein
VIHVIAAVIQSNAPGYWKGNRPPATKNQNGGDTVKSAAADPLLTSPLRTLRYSGRYVPANSSTSKQFKPMIFTIATKKCRP